MMMTTRAALPLSSSSATLRKKDIAQCLSFSSDGKMLAVAGGKVDDVGTAARVRVYVTDQKDDEPEINPLVKAYHAEHLVTDISFAPSGENAYGGLNQPLRIAQGPTSPELESAQTRTLRLDPQTNKPIQLEDVPVGGNEEADKCSLVEQKRADASADPPANASSRPGGVWRVRRSSSRMPNPSSPSSSDTDPEAKDEEDGNDDMLFLDTVFAVWSVPCSRRKACRLGSVCADRSKKTQRTVFCIRPAACCLWTGFEVGGKSKS